MYVVIFYILADFLSIKIIIKECVPNRQKKKKKRKWSLRRYLFNAREGNKVK